VVRPAFEDIAKMGCETLGHLAPRFSANRRKAIGAGLQVLPVTGVLEQGVVPGWAEDPFDVGQDSPGDLGIARCGDRSVTDPGNGDALLEQQIAQLLDLRLGHTLDLVRQLGQIVASASGDAAAALSLANNRLDSFRCQNHSSQISASDEAGAGHY